MKRIVLVVGMLLAYAGSALAMSQSSIPPKFPESWAANAAAAYIRSIPVTSQIGIINCAASLADGFPPLTFTPPGAGGCPPFGQDFNGILKQITQWSQWQNAGGPVVFDSAFSTAVTGYPKGSMLQSATLVGRLWLSTTDNNTTNPDATDGTSAGWVVPPGMLPAGTPIPSLSSADLVGSVTANGQTVGNAASNGTNRANADTFWLFTFLWTNCAGCQIFNSSGSITTKGATAAADFAANKAMATINMNGTGLIGADSQSGTTSTFLSSAPVVSGSRTVPGSFLGNNLQSLTVGEIPTIASAGPAVSVSGNVSVGSQVAVVQGTVVNVTLEGGPSPLQVLSGASSSGVTSVGSIVNDSANVTGALAVSSTSTGGTAPTHNIVERSVVTYWNLSL